MTFYRRLRLRYGLRWAKWYPTPSRDFWVLLGVVLAYGIADYVDDLGDRAAKWEKAYMESSAYKKTLIGCMNGHGFYFPDTKAAFICEATRI